MADLLIERSPLTDVTGIDHIYITVSELARSEPFYDRVLRDALGFRKNTFTLAGDPHIQYYNRLFENDETDGTFLAGLGQTIHELASIEWLVGTIALDDTEIGALDFLVSGIPISAL